MGGEEGGGFEGGGGGGVVEGGVGVDDFCNDFIFSTRLMVMSEMGVALFFSFSISSLSASQRFSNRKRLPKISCFCFPCQPSLGGGGGGFFLKVLRI